MKNETIQIKLLIKKLISKLLIYDINSHIMHLPIMYKKNLPVSVSKKVEEITFVQINGVQRVKPALHGCHKTRKIGKQVF